MSAELLAQIVKQMESLRPQDLHVLEMHAAVLRRTRRVQIGQTYEISDFPKGESKVNAITQIRILEEGTSLLHAKSI